jgi:uncharacterized protein (TIGR02246 family)
MPMKPSIVALLLALAAVSPSLASDVKEDIVAAEKNAWKAYANHDAKAYGDSMTEDAIVAAATGGTLTGKQAILADLSSTACKVKSYEIGDTKVRQLSADAAVLTYNFTQDVTCGANKLPPKIFATSIYVRQGSKWRWTSYQETAQP